MVSQYVNGLREEGVVWQHAGEGGVMIELTTELTEFTWAAAEDVACPVS